MENTDRDIHVQVVYKGWVCRLVNAGKDESQSICQFFKLLNFTRACSLSLFTGVCLLPYVVRYRSSLFWSETPRLTFKSEFSQTHRSQNQGDEMTILFNSNFDAP